MKEPLAYAILERLEAIQKERAAIDAKLADALAEVLKAVGQPECATVARDTVIATSHPETVDAAKTQKLDPP
jgi:hypothetical protein